MLRGITRDILLCALSALLLILSFPYAQIWIFAWFGFIPFFTALRNKSKRCAFLLAYLTGVLFWTGVIYWLAHVTFIGTGILILHLAVYFGVFGLIASLISPKFLCSVRGVVLLPSVWVLLEYIRSYVFTGFPWALLGYSQYRVLPVIQIADFAGAWGVSFLVMLFNVAVFAFISSWLRHARGKKAGFIVCALCIFGTLIYGYFAFSRYNTVHDLKEQIPRIAVVQPNIPQELKWDDSARGFIMDRFIALTTQASQNTLKPDMIIWPEAALPVVAEEEPAYIERVKALAREINVPILLGAVTENQGKYFNSALFLSASGALAGKYHKIHLVPFGEYIPLRAYLKFLETIAPIGEIEPGKEYVVFSDFKNDGSFSKSQFSVLICFEDLFPELSRKFVKQGARFLVNITNDAWYKETSAPFQHFQASVFRAVENRVSVVRSANTGISGFITPLGRIESLAAGQNGKNIFVSALQQGTVYPIKEKSFYSRYGDFFIGVCVFFVLCGVMTPRF